MTIRGHVINFLHGGDLHLLGRIYAVENRGYHRDVGTIESLRQANADAVGMASAVRICDRIGRGDPVGRDRKP